ncbi:MAG TPA: class I SAM-dependent methyltransferase [Candidatus Acidoferrales bacterium]|nr:class I SAM-dependent methyltransferase [Candidatus Acidoferrales bacterium]
MAQDDDGTAARPEEAHWIGIPEVQVRYGLRATGQPNLGWHVYCLSFLPRERWKHARMLVLGDGSQWLEADLHARGAFERLDVLDPSPAGVEAARANAGEALRRVANYEVADFETLTLPRDTYDAIWCNMRLGYVVAIERLVAQLARSLRPGGLLMANEYVGPGRYRLPARQRRTVEAAFSLIPARYRRRFGRHDCEVQETPQFPSADRQSSGPPSSSAIASAVSQHFTMLQYRPAGGTILQFALEGIAGNFRSEDRGSMRILEMLFAIEDALIDTGEIGSDFAVFVAQPKPRED